MAILGCGALGSVAAELLARAGVGRLRLIDRDVVEWSNLQRQSLYDEQDATLGTAKAEAAAIHLRRINSSVRLDERVTDVTHENIRDVLKDVDLVMDAVDNFALRLLLNDWSLATRTPWVHGGCVGATGQVRLFPATSPCFRCLVPDLPEPGSVATCDSAGVIAPATHLIASLQVCEAMKWLTDQRDAVRDEVFSIDLWRNQIHNVRIDSSASESCPACRLGRFDFLNAEPGSTQRVESLCGRDAVQISGSGGAVPLDRIAESWARIGGIQKTRFFVRLQIDASQTVTLFRDGRAVISGCRDASHARAIYDRYVGQ